MSISGFFLILSEILQFVWTELDTILFVSYFTVSWIANYFSLKRADEEDIQCCQRFYFQITNSVIEL